MNALMAAVGFNEADLAANRAGMLSDGQRQKLRAMQRRAVGVGGGAVIVLVFVATGFLYGGRQTDSGILTLVGIGLTFSSTLIMGLFTRHWLRLNADLSSGQVGVLSGKVERIIRVSGRVTTFVLKIGDDRLPLSHEMLKGFEHDRPYRLYRTAYTRLLLSAERLPE